MTDDSEKAAFRNVKDVAEYLRKTGRKVSQATVYNHKNKGMLVPDRDGGFSRKSVDIYVKTWLDKSDPLPLIEAAKAQKDKKSAEAMKIEAQAEHWRIKTNILKGKYIDRDQYDRDLASRAMLLKADGNNFFRSMTPEIVAMVDGDPELISDLTEFFVKKWESFLGRYSGKREFIIQSDMQNAIN